MRKLFFFLIGAMLVLPMPRAASQDTSQLSPTFRSQVDLVALAVTVQAPNGSFVRDLRQDRFHVFEKGVEQPITVFGAGEVPIDLVLLIDTSNSMTSRLPAARHAAGVLLESLADRDRAAVIAFGGRVRQLTDLTTDRHALLQAVNRVRPGGSTPLHDAVYMALKEFGHGDLADLRRRALIVLTDGEDTASHVPFDSVLEVARQRGIAVYAVSLQSDTSSPDERSESAAYELKTLARETGAQAFFPRPTDNLDRIYGSIASELANQYSVGYQPRSVAGPHQFTPVRVLVDGPTRMDVRTRTGYVATQ